MSEIRPDRDVTGIVLAGGRSSRFGSDKLAAVLDGRPLLAHAIAAVAAVAVEVIVVAAPGAEPAIPAGLVVPVRVIHDPESYGGPLVGLLAGARAARGTRLVVAAGDMPGLVPAVLAALVAAVAPPTVTVAHLAVGGDRIHPLPLAADVAAVLRAAPALLAAGERSLRALLTALDATALAEPEWRALDRIGTTLRDVDRPGDLDRPD